MNGYTVEQIRTFGRLQAYILTKGIKGKSWADVQVNTNGIIAEWPDFFPEDEDPDDLYALIEDDDEAEQAGEEAGIEQLLAMSKRPLELLIKALLEELLPTRRSAVINKVTRTLRRGNSGNQGNRDNPGR